MLDRLLMTGEFQMRGPRLLHNRQLLAGCVAALHGSRCGILRMGRNTDSLIRENKIGISDVVRLGKLLPVGMITERDP